MAGIRQALALLALTACVTGRGIGKGAAQGTIEAASQTKASTGVAPTETIAANAIKGTLETLTQPKFLERQRLLAGTLSLGALESILAPRSGSEVDPPGHIDATAVEQLGDQFGSAFAASMGRQLMLSLGPQGDGPLAQSLAATSERASQQAARGIDQATSQLIAHCQGTNRDECLHRLLDNASRTAGAGFVEGAMGALRWPLFALAFGVGVVFSAVLALLVLSAARPRPAST